MENELFRQGDVLIRQISQMPKNLKQKEKIVAYGEVTGHKHQFKGEKTKVFDGGSSQYAILEEPDTLVHEEHKPISLPKGVYEIKIQRELDILGEVRQVAD